MKNYIFKTGDIVYHSDLKMTGKFDRYDNFEKTTCFVKFETEDGLYDGRRVSLDCLKLVVV